MKQHDVQIIIASLGSRQPRNLVTAIGTTSSAFGVNGGVIKGRSIVQGFHLLTSRRYFYSILKLIPFSFFLRN